jgi:alpha-glucosidase
MDQRPLLESSRLGLDLRGGLVLGAAVEILDAQRRRVDVVWQNIPGGKRRLVRNHANELTLRLRSSDATEFGLVFRAYNDGVAFRYLLPGHPRNPADEFILERELTEFRFAEDFPAYLGQHAKPSFHGPQEWEFRPGRLGDVKSSDVVGCPVLVQTPAAWVALTESDLVDWAGMWLAGADSDSAGGVALTTKLAPRQDGSGLVKGKCPSQSPWRVVMIGRKPGDLIESDLVLNLARPARPGDWSWVRPGLMAWDAWWSRGQPPTANPGMNTAMLKEYIQFAADMGWPYQLIDWWWYGEPNQPTSDPRKISPDVDMEAVRRFAADRGVKLWIWVRFNDLERFEPAEEFFARMESWGMAGVKIDFMDRDDQEMVDWYERIAATAAKHRLMVNFHGAMKPTGMNRTWPNQVTREGILGNEYNKWSERITPEHKVTLPFTRFLCGPGDFTPGGFLNRQPASFRKGKPAQVQGTRAAELALFVVYDSPLQCVCDAPENIVGQPGADFLKRVPTVWEETHVLNSQVADYLAMARRAADGSWYIGGITDGTAREVEVKLDFLGAGDWQLQLWRDTPATDADAQEMVSESSRADAGRTLKIRLSPASGFAGRLTRE